MRVITKIKQPVIIFLSALVVFMGSPFVELALAQPIPPTRIEQEQNSSIVLQFFGGFVGGMLVGYTAFELFLRYRFCQDSPTIGSEPATEAQIKSCIQLARGSSRGIFYSGFIFAGSSLGIAAVGLLSQTQGNYIAMGIGTLSGAFSGSAIWSDFFWHIIEYLAQPERVAEISKDENTPLFWRRFVEAFVAFLDTKLDVIEENVKLYVPIVIAAVMGVIGFNIGT